MKYLILTGCILLIIFACAKFDFNNPVDPDIKKDPPELISPLDDTIINDNSPTFTWSADNEAAGYALQVDNNVNFSSPVIDQSYITANSYIFTHPLLDDEYFWRVRVRYGEDSWKTWSSEWSFKINVQDLPIPSLSIPSNGSKLDDNTPYFDWSDVSDVSVYELEVDNSSSFVSPEIDQNNLNFSDYTAISMLLEGTYFWHVRCRNSQGHWGNWSVTWSFSIETMPGTVKIGRAHV